MTLAATSSVDRPSPALLRPRGQWLELALPLAFAAAVLAMGLWANVFEYDSDEGINLMKGLLVSRGFRLYSDIRSDQPPVMSYLLAILFKGFGPSVVAARCLVLAFSTVMLWAVFSMLRRLEDSLTATLAVLFLATMAWYMRLSFSVMIGLPSIAMATVALCLLVHWRCGGRWILLALSAVAMAVSIQIKMSSATVLPVMVIVIVLRNLDGDEAAPAAKSRIVPLLAWLGIVALVCGGIIIASGQVFDQVITSHRDAAAGERFKLKIQFLSLLRRDPDIIFLALTMSGIVVPLVETGYSLRRMLPLIWAGVAAVAVQFHRPVWPHYILLLAVPFAWSAALGVRPLVIHVRKMLAGQAGRWGKTDGSTFSIPSVVIVAVVAGFFGYKLVSRSALLFDNTNGAKYAAMAAQLDRYGAETKYVFADRMMLPFRAGLVASPSLAVVAGKREAVSELRDSLSLEELRRFRPEQIIIGRRKFGPEMMGYITANYRAVGQFKTHRPDEHVYVHYVRNGSQEGVAESAAGQHGKAEGVGATE